MKNLEEIANSELSLLLLCQLLQGNKKGATFTIPEITKNQLEHFPEAIREFKDTNDYRSPYDLVLYKIEQILNNLKLGQIKSYTLWDSNKAIEDLFQLIANNSKDANPELLDSLKRANEQLVLIDRENRRQREEILLSDPEDLTAQFDPSIEIGSETFETEYDDILHIVPEHITINVALDQTQGQKVKELLSKYILGFAEDKYYWVYGDYQKHRSYFSQQIDTFYKYLSSLSSIKGSYNIPFSVVKNESFEIVKILKYLEITNKIEIYWGEKSSWKIELSTTISSPQDLLDDSLSPKVQIFLGYSEPESILSYGDDKLKITGADQKFVLKVLFENNASQVKEWQFSQICEMFEHTEKINEKKFYNASRQIIRRFQMKHGVENVLITTSTSVRINPKYLKSS